MSMGRTDLALECHERLSGAADGVVVERRTDENASLTRIEVTDGAAARALGKPQGVYYTLQMEALPDASSLTDGRLRLLTDALEALLPPEGAVLAVGLGNRGVTPDALGPKCADLIFATRHIDADTRKALSLPELREVSVLSPGVTGQTGVEAVELIASAVKTLRPAAVIAVDALAAASAARVATTVQLSSVGVEPGSGVGNARRALNKNTVGVPVIAMGVPTVVDAVSLAEDVLGVPGGPADRRCAGMMVTPREIDTVTDSFARLLALAVNCVLQKNMTAASLLSLM